MGRIIEGYWICPYCNSRNRGSHKNCTSCGRPRGDEVKFKLDNNCNYVDENEAKSINRNPDWVCDHCDTLNSDNENICINCGNPRNHEDISYFENIEKKEEMEQLRDHDKTLREYRENYESDYSSYNKTYRTNHSSNITNLLLPILSILGSIGLIGLLIFLLIPKPKEIIVNGFEWNVNVTIEEYKEVERSGWSLPPNATLRYSQEEFYGTEQVFSHYETVAVTKTREVFSHYEEYVTGYRDLGNGYFEEQTSSRPVYITETYTDYEEKPVYNSVPIYKTKYYYNIFEWVYSRTVTNSGTNKNPYIPVYTLTENERDNTPNYTYYVLATVLDKEEYAEKFTTSKEIWEKLEKEMKINVKISMNHITEIIEEKKEIINE